MKKQILRLFFAVLVIIPTACQNTAEKKVENSTFIGSRALSLKSAMLETAVKSYYPATASSALAFMKHKSVQRFLAMWVKEATGDIEQPIWLYDSFSPVTARNHKLEKLHEDKQLYSCVFTDGNGRYGYCIFQYHEDESAFSNWGVKETTPYVYDLRVNEELITDNLMKTDIDLLTTEASRVYLYDEEKKHADQAVLFTDCKKNYYICYYGDAVLKTEKWKTT